MSDQIKITSVTQYNTKYPPKNAKKGYVAKITGRAKGATKYEREFLGDEAALLPGDEGVYERQDGNKKGGYTRYYHVLLSHPQHGLILSTDCEEAVPKIAKLLDDGHAIDEIVEISDLREIEYPSGRMVFTATVRTAAQMKQAAKSATQGSAIDCCLDVLGQLPQAEQKKVLAELRKRVSPPQQQAAKILRSIN